MGSQRVKRAGIEVLKVLLLAAVFYGLQAWGGAPWDRGGRTASAEARAAAARDAERKQERLIEECTAELSRARVEIAAFRDRTEADQASLKKLLDARTVELEGSLLRRLAEEQKVIEERTSVIEKEVSQVERLSAAFHQDPEMMKRRMILPTVQLKGNGTVGSGILVYSQPQPELAEPVGGEGSPADIHTTLILTAYHVVLEVMGDRAERGLVDEVHVVKDADSGSTEVFSAKLVLFDRARDISLLRLNATAKFEQVVEFLPAKDLKAVDIFTRAYAVGCPLGNRPLPTLGEISSKSKLVADQVFWMLSAPTFFGNSGGGVYLADSCRLIGVSSMIYTYGKANPTVVPHMGLFVPIETIYRWLDGEGYSFIHERKQIPREILWKIAYVEKNTLFPRPAAGPSGE